jgi:hypothetical protein
MRMTFRSFTWEYGPLIVLTVGPLLMALPWVVGSWGVIPTVPWVVWAVYGLRLSFLYPRRGDLPEWKEYTARQRERKPSWD